MTKFDFPCIICEEGDVYSNIVCDECQYRIDQMNEINEEMESFVRHRNDLVGHIPMDISDKVRDEVRKIFNQLVELKIEGKERCH